MDIVVKSRHCDVTEEFRAYVAEKITRLEKLDEDVIYDARQLDRDVVAVDQIRTVIRTFRHNLFKPLDADGIFPGRSEVPKTLIFAKDGWQPQTRKAKIAAGGTTVEDFQLTPTRC